MHGLLLLITTRRAHASQEVLVHDLPPIMQAMTVPCAYLLGRGNALHLTLYFPQKQGS